MSPTYRRYALAALTAIYVLNLADRMLMMLLLQPIKEDLGLTDTQLGFVTGIAFGLFYATVGVPIARWADRGNRVTIASLAIGLWGMTVMACVLVTNYTQLVFARIAAAVGESGCKPPTYSLVGDYFPRPEERTRAMSVYWLGAPLASLLTFTLGGWLNGLVGWRMTFFLMGIPGLALALLVRLTIVEPRTQAAVQTLPVPPISAVLSVLWHQQSCRHLSIALVLFYTLGFGMAPWYAAFLMRSHGMVTSEVGLWLGLIFGLGGIAGVLLGGYVSTRWFADDEPGQMRMSAVTAALIVPCFVAFLTLPHKQHALMALMPLIVVFNVFLAPAYALLQRLVPDEMRATVMAIVMLLVNLIGMGIGPQLVGMLSDALMPFLGANSLRYAMLTLSFVAFLAAYHFWRVGRSVRTDLTARGTSWSTQIGNPVSAAEGIGSSKASCRQ
ncbi:MAG TPA: MFS transporter [Povalibacter sp.]|nr:MFS transporter [Povalibacter sp.]